MVMAAPNLNRRVCWRKVRTGTPFEKGDDLAYNEALAAEITSAPLMDDILIALDLIGWRLAGPDAAQRWPMRLRTRWRRRGRRRPRSKRRPSGHIDAKVSQSTPSRKRGPRGACAL